jgi:hypothetical protein
MKIIDPETRQCKSFSSRLNALQRRRLALPTLAAKTTYRIKTEYLLHESLTSVQLGAKVKHIGTTYLTAIEDNASARFDPRSRNPLVVVQMAGLHDVGTNGKFYVTTSQIHRMPEYHGGVSKQQDLTMIYRMKLPFRKWRSSVNARGMTAQLEPPERMVLPNLRENNNRSV